MTTDAKPRRRSAAPRGSQLKRTLDLVRNTNPGAMVDVVERWVTFGGEAREGFGRSPGHRKDLFGCIDAVALVPNEFGMAWTIIGIQATSRAQMAAHRRKVERDSEIERAVRCWLMAGGRFVVVGWEKVGSRYRARIEEAIIELVPLMQLGVSRRRIAWKVIASIAE